jgi:2-amino-4-hydroxy-6-hydroxymethyldihydropteridine diphosphokinase
MSPPGIAFIALGSNLGNPTDLVRRAIEQLQLLSDQPLLKSSLWQSTPVDCPPGSPPFVNAVVGLAPRTAETPATLLRQLQKLEKKFGRRPKKILNEPRPLDLDLIAFGSQTMNSPNLILPHPRAHLRRFVLQPLSEIAPDFVFPGQTKTVRQLSRGLKSREVVRELLVPLLKRTRPRKTHRSALTKVTT